MRLSPTNDLNNPKLKAIKAALAANPNLSKKHLSIGFEVGVDTLIKWDKLGWISLLPTKKRK